MEIRHFNESPNGLIGGYELLKAKMGRLVGVTALVAVPFLTGCSASPESEVASEIPTTTEAPLTTSEALTTTTESSTTTTTEAPTMTLVATPGTVAYAEIDPTEIVASGLDGVIEQVDANPYTKDLPSCNIDAVQTAEGRWLLDLSRYEGTGYAIQIELPLVEGVEILPPGFVIVDGESKAVAGVGSAATAASDISIIALDSEIVVEDGSRVILTDPSILPNVTVDPNIITIDSAVAGEQAEKLVDEISGVGNVCQQVFNSKPEISTVDQL